MSMHLTAYEKWHRQIFSGIGAIGFGLIIWAAFAVGLSQGAGAAIARMLSWAIVIATLVWMVWVIWHRDSKARWLSLAIIVEWFGVVMLYLPSVELHKQNGFCIPALEVGKSFELAGLFFGLTATIWLAAGAWLVKKERDGLHDALHNATRVKLMAGLLASAHQQVSLGLLTALIGVVTTLASPVWEVYSKVNGIEEPKEQTCLSGQSKKEQSRQPEATQHQRESGG